MREKLLSNWGFMRVFRLALGIYIIVQGIHANEWMFIVLGALFSIMPLMNIGCCGASGCNTTQVNTKNNKNEEVKYEEVR